MRGNGEVWKGVPNCTYTSIPFYLKTEKGLQKAGWKIKDEISARTAWCFMPMMWYNSRRYLLYHVGYAVPIGGEKARLRRLEAGLSKERVRQIQKNYPKQMSMFMPKPKMPGIEGNDIDPFDIDIEVEQPKPPRARIRLQVGPLAPKQVISSRQNPESVEIEFDPYDIEIEVLPMN